VGVAGTRLEECLVVGEWESPGKLKTHDAYATPGHDPLRPDLGQIVSKAWRMVGDTPPVNLIGD